MRIKPYRALSGKARRARDRSRVARVQAHALLDDFYGLDDREVGAERPIPIRRRRREFLPTVAVESEILREPLDLPPAPIEANTTAADRSRRLGQVAKTRDAEPADGPFSMSGFLMGCALGGAAAAALLLAATIVLG